MTLIAKLIRAYDRHKAKQRLAQDVAIRKAFIGEAYGRRRAAAKKGLHNG